MTNKEKEAIVKAAFPGIEGMELSFAIGLVRDNDSVAVYKNRVGQAPQVLKNEMSAAGVIKGAQAAIKGGSVAFKYIKSVLPGGKTAAKKAEEALTTTKWSGKKKVVVGTAATASAFTIGQSAANLMQGDKNDKPTDVFEKQSENEFLQSIVNANNVGSDVNSYLESDTGQLLGINKNNVGNKLAGLGYDIPLVGIGNVGIFTGTETETSSPRRKYGGIITGTKKELVSLANWNKSFPADLEGIASAKQKFVDAGVLDPTADMTQVKTAWDTYGNMSLEYSRAGSTLSPWQLLDIQKGLMGGGGSQTNTTIDDSPMATSDIRSLTRQQLSKSLGLADIDDKSFKEILKIVRKKEAKNPTKSVRTTTGNTTRVKTTPGYGSTDVLADAEAYAKQDPRYADFQTGDVFGSALVQALGLKS